MQRGILLRRCTTWRVPASAAVFAMWQRPVKVRGTASTTRGADSFTIALTSSSRHHASHSARGTPHTPHKRNRVHDDDVHTHTRSTAAAVAAREGRTLDVTARIHTPRASTNWPSPPPPTWGALSPRSAQSFAERLRFGNFISVLDLAHAPYAPEPLQVLRELLIRAAQPCPSAKSTPDKDTQRRVGSLSALSSLSCTERTRRYTCVTQALSRAADVRRLLAEAVTHAQHRVHVARELGDEESECAVQRALRQLHDFTDFYVGDGWRARLPETAAPLSGEGKEEEEEEEEAPVWKDALAHSADDDGYHGRNTADVCAVNTEVLDDGVNRNDDERCPLHTQETNRITSTDTDIDTTALHSRCTTLMCTSSTLPLLTQSCTATTWCVPEAVQVEVLHGLLHMASVLGCQSSAIYLLDAMLQQHARVGRASNSATTRPSLWSRVPCAPHHIAAMRSCASAGDFDTAALLHRRLLRHAQSGQLVLSVAHLTDAMVSLAQCVRRAADYRALRHYLVCSDASRVIPISVPLYTSLMEALSRVTDMSSQRRMSHALALYRALQDANLAPRLETYTALVGCAAMCGATTEAFAWYHAARTAPLHESHIGRNGKDEDGESYKLHGLSQASTTHDDAGSIDSHRSDNRKSVMCGGNEQGNRVCTDVKHDNTSQFPPAMYAHLLSAYIRGGYAADARDTLRVLVEAGAPLTRMAWHALLDGDPTLWTVREVEEVLSMMETRYRLRATPACYGFLIQVCAGARAPPETVQSGTGGGGGVTRLLRLVEIHERVEHVLLEQQQQQQQQQQKVAHASPAGQQEPPAQETSSHDVEEVLLTRHPDYVAALEEALVHLRVSVPSLSHIRDEEIPDMEQGSSNHQEQQQQQQQQQRSSEEALRTARSLRRLTMPLIRLAQRRMNAHLARSPQLPTRLPDGSCSCVAVLAADVLGDVRTLVQPLVSYYSAIVIPYSAVWQWRQNCLHNRGRSAVNADKDEDAKEGDSLGDATTRRSEEEEEAMELRAATECARQQTELRQFLHTYRDVIHLVSLEEEMRWSRDWRRYGVAMHDLHARSAAMAIHLARSDVCGYDDEEDDEQLPEDSGEWGGHVTGQRNVTECARGVGHDGDAGGDSALCAVQQKQPRRCRRQRAWSHGSLYASLGATVVVVSTSYARCGRVVQDLKAHYGVGGGRAGHEDGKGSTPNCWGEVDDNSMNNEDSVCARGGEMNNNNDHNNNNNKQQRVRADTKRVNESPELREALSRVYYHNPLTKPDWTPPTHSAAAAAAMRVSQSWTGAAAAATTPKPPVRRDEGVRALPVEAASRLYRTALTVDEGGGE